MAVVLLLHLADIEVDTVGDDTVEANPVGDVDIASFVSPSLIFFYSSLFLRPKRIVFSLYI